MPKLNMSVPHHLTREEALKRVKTLLGDTKTRYADKISNLREEWNDSTGTFSLTAMGFSVSGTLTVNPADVQLSANVPFAAMLLKGRIESAIRERAETLFA